MNVYIENILNCSARRLFEEVQKTENFFYVTRPLVRFVPRDCTVGTVWKDGAYLMNMYFLGFLPLGSQYIDIQLDKANMSVHDRGHSKLIPKWHHLIRIQEAGETQALYSDCIDIDAGPLTLPVVLFARCFFYYRQYRWKKLVNRGFGTDVVF